MGGELVETLNRRKEIRAEMKFVSLAEYCIALRPYKISEMCTILAFMNLRGKSTRHSTCNVLVITTLTLYFVLNIRFREG